MSISWRDLVSVTSVTRGTETVAVATGLCTQHAVFVERVASARLNGGETAQKALHRLVCATHLPHRRVTVTIPRRILATRYLTLPSQRPRELDAMVHHQVGIDLPLDLDAVAYVKSTIGFHGDGSATVLVHLVRRSQLEQYVQPYREAGLDVLEAIPEGYVLAYRADRVLGGPTGPQAIAIFEPPALHLILEEGGALLSHHVARLAPSKQVVAEFVDECRADILRLVSRAHADLTDQVRRPLPRVLHLWATPQDSELDREALSALAAKLTESLATPVAPLAASLTAGSNHCGEHDDPEHHARQERLLVQDTALALALVGGQAQGTCIGFDVRRPEDARRQRSCILARTGLLGLLCLLLMAAGARGDLRVLRTRLRAADQRLARLAPEGAPPVLGGPASAVGGRSPADPQAPLHALAAIRANAPTGISLQQFTYGPRGTVALQGSATDVGVATDFYDRLAASHEWRDVHLQGLYRAGSQSNAPFRFEIEGHYAPKSIQHP